MGWVFRAKTAPIASRDQALATTVTGPKKTSYTTLSTLAPFKQGRAPAVASSVSSLSVTTPTQTKEVTSAFSQVKINVTGKTARSIETLA